VRLFSPIKACQSVTESVLVHCRSLFGENETVEVSCMTCQATKRDTTRTAEISSLALVTIGVMESCNNDFTMRVLNSVSITTTVIVTSEVVGL
jgi:hypothetical protein